MTWYKCQSCGKGFNSDTLKQCPYCNMPTQKKAVSPTHLSKKMPLNYEELCILIEAIAEKKARELLDTHEENYVHTEKEVSVEEIEHGE